jgi:ribosomal protein S18 acetylase RimI-like enzyme
MGDLSAPDLSPLTDVSGGLFDKKPLIRNMIQQPAHLNHCDTVVIESNIALRAMVESDIEFLRHLYSTTRYDFDHLPLSNDERNQFLNQQFQAQHTHYQRFCSDTEFDVVLCGEKRIGRFYVQHASTEFRIVDIAILPEYRGSGIGTKIMHEVLERATIENLPVRLRVVPNNQAVTWYMRMGFRKIDDEQTHWHMEWVSSKMEK